MKIVFFGTSAIGIPVLQSLVTEHEVVLVVTSPDAPVGRKQILTQSAIATAAAELRLPISKPAKAKNNPELINELRDLNADIFVVISYGKILPAALISIPPLKTINIHFSLLPQYRGASPIQFALLNGETVTGTTIFVLDELVDHGPILATLEEPINADDTFASLATKLAELSAQLLIKILPDYSSGKITPREQNHEAATFTTLITKEHGRIDWGHDAQTIYNQYRALQTWPGVWTTWHGALFKIIDCRPASFVASHKDTLYIPCGNNSLLAVTQLQLEGKKPMSAADFLRGHPAFNPAELQ